MKHDPEVPSPVGIGWKISDEHLVIHWMDRQPAPQAILDLLACTCAKSACDCLANGLNISVQIDMRRLPDCDNQADHFESEDELDNEEPDEDLEY